MVLDKLSKLAGLVKVRHLADKAVIDNPISRLHHRATTAICFLFCFLCTFNSLVGNAIECLVKDDKMQKVINTYCWIQSTFTVPLKLEKEIEGVNVAAPGVRHYTEDEDIVRHAYYQWVPFMLFFQGLLFYAPHWIWKNWEDGKMSAISDGVRGVLAETREERKDRQSRLVRYLTNSLDTHAPYALGYFLCEILNFGNVIGNIYLTDKFLGGTFLTYGINVLYPDSSGTAAYYLVFPRVTKCTFHTFGHSGSINTIDSLCVLAVNIINEKIYIFLWWWFIILTVVTGLSLIYSIAIIASPAIRRNILFRRFKFRTSRGVNIIVQKMHVGDFLVLHLLGQNINKTVFNDILEELVNNLTGSVPKIYTTNLPSSEGLPTYLREGRRE